MRFTTAARLSRLTPLQQNFACRVAGQATPEPDDEVAPATCAALWLAGLLNRNPFLVPEQRALILEQVWPTISDRTRSWVDKSVTPGTQPTVIMVLTNRRYLAWTGHVGYLDLTTGKTVTALPSGTIECMSYDVHAMFMQAWATCTQLELKTRRQGADDADPSEQEARVPTDLVW